MGLLDDAIRDHIELKRRHGANPGEVARIEHEALGPARREPVAAVSYDDDDLDGPPTVEDEPASPAATGESGAVAAVQEPPDLPEPAAEAPAPAAEPADERADAPEPAPDAPAAGDERPSGPFDFEADPAEGHEDVLEETPEFLQETPEHDRLWFEQKPPRDFDFDK
jgi:hypothetical protein